jgi:hypothetical protein
MGLYRFAWLLWILGTVLIVLSWTNTVPVTVGWIGFGIACVGVLLSFIPHIRQKSEGHGDGPKSA